MRRLAAEADLDPRLGPFVALGLATAARMREWRMASGRPPGGAPVFVGLNLWRPFDRAPRTADLNDPQPTVHSLRPSAGLVVGRRWPARKG